MYIVQIAPECAPVAKVGGLGDVVFGLSRELEIRGNEVHIILPKYDCMRYDHIWGSRSACPIFGCLGTTAPSIARSGSGSCTAASVFHRASLAG